jgi:hypothetical protein
MRHRFAVADCTCGHSRRGHYGGSGRLADAGTCKTTHCACRTYQPADPARQQSVAMEQMER